MPGHVLVVEDNPYSLELMTYLLVASGHRVTGIVSGGRALGVAAACDIDLVLLDLQLPDHDGYDVLRRLRSVDRLSDVKIVAVTAVAMVGDRERTLAAGFDHYIPKPINPRTFVAEVAAWLPLVPPVLST